MLRLDCLTPKNILQNSENLIQYVWKSNSFGEFLLGIFTYFYSYLTDVLLNKTNGEITCYRSIISHKNLRITWEFFQAQNPDFLRISKAQKILSDSYKEKSV